LLSATIKVEAEPQIRIGPVVLHLVYSPPESPVGIREYVLPGESTESWTRMGSVRVFKNEKKVQEYLDRVGSQVVRSHPSAKARLLKHDKSGDFVLDFLMFTPDSTIAEWNLMRAKYDKTKGLIVYQYAARFRTNSELAPAILAERAKMFEPFMAATFQEEANQTSQPTPGS
jgi:hypothetical protein